MGICRQIAPQQVTRIGGEAVDPFQAGTLHPPRRPWIIPGNIVEQTTAGNQPAATKLVFMPQTEGLFLGLTEPDPQHIGLCGVDLINDCCLLGVAEVAVPRSHDVQTGRARLGQGCAGLRDAGASAKQEQADAVHGGRMQAVIIEIGCG